MADEPEGGDAAEPEDPTPAGDGLPAAEGQGGRGEEIVLAIGAGGGEPEALIGLLAGLAADAPFAVIIALQHREALDEALLRSALGPRAPALVHAADRMPLAQGQFYLLPADVIATVEQGRLHLRPVEQATGRRGAIDSLFTSLAEDPGRVTIGVVLAGTANDGTYGFAALKEAGGFTIAEDDGGVDPHAPITVGHPAALADAVLTASEIPSRVLLHARHLARVRTGSRVALRAEDEQETLRRIAAILREHTGYDFQGYKLPTFLRRVRRRMEFVGTESYDAYVERLRSTPGEPQNLFNDLLIGVTRFFRDRNEFYYLERHVIPQLFAGKGAAEQLRIWVLGCSTGEEAYSIAILLREYAARLDNPPRMQIFATDIDERALAAARAGRYRDSIAADIGPERLARWFVNEGNTYVVSKALRELCLFSRHSLIRDTPLSRLDMISCRNVLIYLGAELQEQVFRTFHFGLNPGGYLFLGNSENVAHHSHLFAPVERSHRIFQRIGASARLSMDLPANVVAAAPRQAPSLWRGRGGTDAVIGRAERLVEQYAPAYAIVDETFEVLHFSRRAGRFIHPAGGAASLNLINLAHGDLRLDLQAALTRAARQHETVRVRGVPMGGNGGKVLVDLLVEPVRGDEGSSRRFIVLFKDGTRDVWAPSLEQPEDVRARQLEEELRLTRERLQQTVEAFESTNEELKASNEEYQSLNEELQSTNEELATSKEELQSLNEELTTVNGELAYRVQELGRVNSDLKNLLQSTQIATVFLDTDLRVTNFTPAVVDVFHIVETDIGRPISHIKSRIRYDALQEDVRRVMRTLGTIESQAESADGRAHYMVRILPYRSLHNVIAGAVLTFTDVTASTAVQTALRESEAALRRLNETLEARVAERTAELLAAQETLMQAQKMEAVGQLTGGIAHDFNNMLQAIGAGLELMLRRIEQGRTDDLERYVETARRTVDRAAALTRRLLAFARRQTLEPQAIRPGSLIGELGELLQRTIGPGVRLELALADDDTAILCDPNQLEAVLLNLAINARDAMPEGGVLTIATRMVRLGAADLPGEQSMAGDFVEIAVTDTGIGMEAAVRDRAFEPFFTTKPLGQGTGLGLSQIHGFVHQSGGVVRLDSAPGKGTTVRLYLPRYAAPATEGAVAEPGSAPSDAAAAAGTGRQILLIEDEADIRAATAEALREQGYRVLEAGDAAAALALLAAEAGRPIDLMVSDIGLPGGQDGWQVAAAAREARPGLPVLFITGLSGPGLATPLPPGTEVLVKPFTLRAIRDRIAAMLGAGSPRGGG